MPPLLIRHPHLNRHHHPLTLMPCSHFAAHATRIYVQGKNGSWYPTAFPEGHELLLIAFSIVLCSALSSATVSVVESCFAGKNKEAVKGGKAE